MVTTSGFDIEQSSMSFSKPIWGSWPAMDRDCRTQAAAVRLSLALPREHIDAMLKREKFAIANIYVPTKRRSTLKPETVKEIAESMLDVGQQTPILVRQDGDRFVLVEGLHRLEACKALGEETILGFLVDARKH